MEIKIGDKFFVRRDFGYRTVRDPRDLYMEITITGETTRSWTFGNFGERKVPKKNPFSILYTEQMRDDEIWRSQHRFKIGERVTHHIDATTLREVAKLIGYGSDQPKS